MKKDDQELISTEEHIVKKPYEKATIEEHEPLEEATATVYYYYTYAF